MPASLPSLPSDSSTAARARRPRVLVVDNYDSFTYNLVHACAAAGAEVVVRRNDAIDCDGIAALEVDALVLSPGPGRPENAGISIAAIERFLGQLPILGVCLGHQALAHACGARVVRAARPVHGKATRITHDGRGLFTGLESPLIAGRYHSLIVADTPWPACLEITATSLDGEIMGLRYRGSATAAIAEGVQFHPESFLTPCGPALIQAFLRTAASRTTR